MAKSSELKQIRLDLDLNQAEMGKLLGVNTQSAYQAWEVNPEKPAAQRALKLAKELYKKRKGKDWVLDPVGAVAQHALQASFHLPTPGFPEKEIAKATEMVFGFIGTGRLSPYKFGTYVATVAEMLVLGETEEAIRSLLAPSIRTLAHSGSGGERPPIPGQGRD
ncbi:MAG: helix-turn-helix transcriptional regulator [Fibrobacteria bacterium]